MGVSLHCCPDLGVRPQILVSMDLGGYDEFWAAVGPEALAAWRACRVEGLDVGSSSDSGESASCT